MKKIQALLKDKDISKNADFKRIIRIYKACLKHFNKSTELCKKAKANFVATKKKKSTTKEKIHAAKCAYKMAKNYKAMWKKLLKASEDHVERWEELYNDCGTKPSANENSDKKVKADKSTSKKVKDSKSGKSKEKKADTVATDVSKVEVKAKKAKVAASTVKKAAAPKPAVKKSASKAAAVKKVPATSSGKKDDLKKIEGVGPKIEGLLNADGLNSYADVGKSSVAKLQGILDKAGPRYSLARPATWPQQAKLAAAGKWEELSKLQAELKGGQKK